MLIFPPSHTLSQKKALPPVPTVALPKILKSAFDLGLYFPYSINLALTLGQPH